MTSFQIRRCRCVELAARPHSPVTDALEEGFSCGPSLEPGTSVSGAWHGQAPPSVGEHVCLDEVGMRCDGPRVPVCRLRLPIHVKLTPGRGLACLSCGTAEEEQTNLIFLREAPKHPVADGRRRRRRRSCRNITHRGYYWFNAQAHRHNSSVLETSFLLCRSCRKPGPGLPVI